MLRGSFFIVALTICFAQAAFAEDQGVVIQPRVVGGVNAPIVNHKYQVGVYIAGSVCGGALYTPTWVVTAGHCVHGHVNSPNHFQVRAGSNNFWDGGVTSGVSKVIAHPQFNYNTMTFDVALLKLKTSFANAIKANRPIKTIGLAKTLPPTDTIVTLSGFGLTKPSGQLANVLQMANVKMIAKTKCNPSYGNALTASMFCAGIWEGGKGSCQGDSGGPLISNGLLIGVVSFGRVCAAAKFPGVYTSIPQVRGWILKTTGTKG